MKGEDEKVLVWPRADKAQSGDSIRSEDEQVLFRTFFGGNHRRMREDVGYCTQWTKARTDWGPDGVWVGMQKPMEHPQGAPARVGNFYLCAFGAPDLSDEGASWLYAYAYFAKEPAPEVKSVLQALASAVQRHILREAAMRQTLTQALNREKRASEDTCSRGPTLSRGDMMGIASALANGYDVRVRRDVFDNTFGRRR